LLTIWMATSVSKPFQDLWDKIVKTGPKWLVALAIFLVAYVIARIARTLVRKAVGRTSTQGHVDILISQAVAAGIIILGLIVALAEVGMSLSAALAAVGLASVGIGFALQDVLSNLFAGVILLVQHPFTIGDQIRVGELEGMVENVRVRDTQVLTYAGERVFIPNRTVYTNPIINYSSTPSTRVELKLGLKYQKDVEAARSAALEAMMSSSGVLDKPEPVILVESEEEHVVLVIRFWTDSDRNSVAKINSEVSERVLAALSDVSIDFLHETPPEDTSDFAEGYDDNEQIP
jgi:small conductance mechanosensitive channel